MLDAYGSIIPMCKTHPDRKAVFLVTGKGPMCHPCGEEARREQEAADAARMEKWLGQAGNS